MKSEWSRMYYHLHYSFESRSIRACRSSSLSPSSSLVVALTRALLAFLSGASARLRAVGLPTSRECRTVRSRSSSSSSDIESRVRTRFCNCISIVPIWNSSYENEEQPLLLRQVARSPVAGVTPPPYQDLEGYGCPDPASYFPSGARVRPLALRWRWCNSTTRSTCCSFTSHP